MSEPTAAEELAIWKRVFAGYYGSEGADIAIADKCTQDKFAECRMAQEDVERLTEERDDATAACDEAHQWYCDAESQQLDAVRLLNRARPQLHGMLGDEIGAYTAGVNAADPAMPYNEGPERDQPCERDSFDCGHDDCEIPDHKPRCDRHGCPWPKVLAPPFEGGCSAAKLNSLNELAKSCERVSVESVPEQLEALAEAASGEEHSPFKLDSDWATFEGTKRQYAIRGAKEQLQSLAGPLARTVLAQHAALKNAACEVSGMFSKPFADHGEDKYCTRCAARDLSELRKAMEGK